MSALDFTRVGKVQQLGFQKMKHRSSIRQLLPARHWNTVYGVVLVLGRLMLLSACSFGAFGQSEESVPINPITPESQFLELVDLVEEPQKQLDLLDTFLVQFPKYEGMNAIYGQIQSVCVDLKLWDRALAMGDKLLSVDPNDVQAIRLNLQAAEGKKDETLIAKWTARLKDLEAPEGSVNASSTMYLPFLDNPADDLANVDLGSFPKPQRNRLEAILFNRALTENDSKRKLQLLSLFQKEFPKSNHAAAVRYLFFLTYKDRDEHQKALAAAESVLEVDNTREDVLYYAAQVYFLEKRESAKVIAYSDAAEELLSKKARPENVTTEQWEKYKKSVALQTSWMIGSKRMDQQQWNAADKALRAALALVEPRSSMAAGILNNLGWTTYKMGKPLDAIKFYQQCAAIPGSLQADATQSIASIKSEFNLQ